MGLDRGKKRKERLRVLRSLREKRKRGESDAMDPHELVLPFAKTSADVDTKLRSHWPKQTVNLLPMWTSRWAASCATLIVIDMF